MIGTILAMVIIVTLMIGFNALFVAGEFAAVSARKTRIMESANEGNRLAKSLLPILEDPHRLDNYIAASQVGITLSSIVLGIYGQRQVAPLIEPLLQRLPFLAEPATVTGIAAILILILFTTLQVILGELVPKSLAIQYPERVAMATVTPMRWSAEWILRPLIVVLNGSGTFLLKLFGLDHGGGHAHVHSPEEIKLLIRQSYKGGLLDARGQKLLNNAFVIGEMTVGEVAIPRTQMAAIPAETKASEALRFAVDAQHSRIPVYEQNMDHILGFVHIKDLFRLNHVTNGEGIIRQIVRQASFVPQLSPLKEVWNQLRREENYLAIILDEFGGTQGMVTWEDLLEELFGELRDEFDGAEEPLLKSTGHNTYLIRGEAPISYLNSKFGTAFPNVQVHSIGGLIISHLNRVPQVGDVIQIDNVEMRVETMRLRAVETVLLRLPEASSQTEGTN